MKSPLLNYAVAAIFLFFGLAESGCKKSSSDTTVPTVQTVNIISSVTSTTASSGGAITNYGSASVTALGVCWSATNATPVVTDSHTVDTTTTSIYSSKLTNLTPNTTYHVRAYATNTGGTAYGSVITFTTSSTNAVSTATVSTFAGNGTAGMVNGTGTGAQFSNPQGLAIDAAGNLYVADGGNNMIRKVTPAGVVTTFAGSGQVGLADGTGTAAEFYSPRGLTIDASGNIYVADLGNNAIRKITPAGVVTTLAGTGQPGYRNATSDRALFRAPAAVTIDASNNVYVAEKNNHRIRKISSAGIVSTFAGSGIAGYLDATVDTASYFSSPVGISIIPSSSSLYVADLGNTAIRLVSNAGVVTTFAGGAYDYTVLGSPTSVYFNPADQATYITDSNGRILQITGGQVMYVLAGQSSVIGFTNGLGSVALFNSPQATAVDASGNIYVADAGNNAIRKITITR